MRFNPKALGGATTGSALSPSRFQTDTGTGEDRYATCTTGQSANDDEEPA